MKQIYLDNNSTSLIEESAQAALLFFSTSPNFGNPSSVHWAGRRLKSALDEAHEAVAALIGADAPEEICFTSGATESINMAIKGAFFAHLELAGAASDFVLITSLVEHEATLESAHFLERHGARVIRLGVDDQGALNLMQLEEVLAATAGRKRMLSLMAANNETGIIFPLFQVISLLRRTASDVLLHIDAVQAPGKMPFSLKEYPADLVSLSSHKIGGSKGAGALYLRKGTKLSRFMDGGGQERKRRAGTINMPAIAAFSAAAKIRRDLAGLESLRQTLEQKILRIPGAHIQGLHSRRLNNTTNVLFDGVRGESLVMGLDLDGFAVSSGSACNSGVIGPSHVLLAMGHDKVTAASAVRISLGYQNTLEEVDLFADALVRVVDRVRAQRRSAEKLAPIDRRR